MLRTYDGIARGALVTVVATRRTAFGTPVCDVTDGTITLTDIPRHALGVDNVNRKA